MNSIRILCGCDGHWTGASLGRQSRDMSSFSLMSLSPLSFPFSALCAGHTGQEGLSGLEHTAFPPGAETGAKAPVCVLLRAVGLLQGERLLPASGFIPHPVRVPSPQSSLPPVLGCYGLSKPLAAEVPLHPCMAYCGSLSRFSPPSHSPLLAPAPGPCYGG